MINPRTRAFPRTFLFRLHRGSRYQFYLDLIQYATKYNDSELLTVLNNLVANHDFIDHARPETPGGDIFDLERSINSINSQINRLKNSVGWTALYTEPEVLAELEGLRIRRDILQDELNQIKNDANPELV